MNKGVKTLAQLEAHIIQETGDPEGYTKFMKVMDGKDEFGRPYPKVRLVDLLGITYPTVLKWEAIYKREKASHEK